MKIERQEKLLKDLYADKVTVEMEKLERIRDAEEKCPNIDKFIEELCTFPDGKKTKDFEKRKMYLIEMAGCAIAVNKIPPPPLFLVNNPTGMKIFLKLIDSLVDYKNRKLKELDWYESIHIYFREKKRDERYTRRCVVIKFDALYKWGWIKKTLMLNQQVFIMVMVLHEVEVSPK